MKEQLVFIISKKPLNTRNFHEKTDNELAIWLWNYLISMKYFEDCGYILKSSFWFLANHKIMDPKNCPITTTRFFPLSPNSPIVFITI